MVLPSPTGFTLRQVAQEWPVDEVHVGLGEMTDPVSAEVQLRSANSRKHWECLGPSALPYHSKERTIALQNVH
jgi:hypothetical protein